MTHTQLIDFGDAWLSGRLCYTKMDRDCHWRIVEL
jgi:hypothetical protein